MRQCRIKAMLVTGIGQCSLDYLAVVDSYPDLDAKKEVIEWEEQGGGPVATALVALSRLGVKSRFYGIVGSDPEGVKIRQGLVAEGIDVNGLLERERSASQTAFIVIEKDGGKRTIFWRRPSGEALREEELGKDFLRNSDFLLLDGLMRDVSIFAAKRAKNLNIPVMLDAGRLREGMLDIARNSDYVVASEEFAKDIGWDDDPETFRRVLEKHDLKMVTITLGERGSVTFLDNGIIHTPSFEVDVTDTTGAGDVFHGGYVYGILRGWDIRKSIRFASAAAAIKCTRLGGRSGIPDTKSVVRFMEKKGEKL